jgi:hypothetical protein
LLYWNKSLEDEFNSIVVHEEDAQKTKNQAAPAREIKKSFLISMALLFYTYYFCTGFHW